jgi:hypothetical protein
MEKIEEGTRPNSSRRNLGAIVRIGGSMVFWVVTAAHGIVAPNEQPLTWLKSESYEALEQHYSSLQRDYESGKLKDDEIFPEFRKLYEDNPGNAHYFDQWVKAYPKSYSARVARAAYYYRMAWAVRGDDFIANTPQERLIRMQGYLALALQDLPQSLNMTAKPYVSTLYLLNVYMLDGSSEERRKWLDRGTAIDPGNQLLRSRYMISLQPKWGGSVEKMQAFLVECEQQLGAAAVIPELKFDVAAESAANLPVTTTPADRLARWTEVEELSEAAFHAPYAIALAGYARASSELNRRADADRALGQLAQLDIKDAWTLSQMGWIYVREQRMAEGWSVLQRAANLNDAWSQFAVGKTLIQGCPEVNVAADHSAGMIWIRRAAGRDFPEAVAYLKDNDPIQYWLDQVIRLFHLS